ncbi:MAG TPA: tetratricopeptide repeat protein [Gemmataceae bacterium]|jgi:tetratricopeptide (TPR) repeat protein
MSDSPTRPSLSAAEARQIDRACDQFEAAWKSGRRPDPATFLAGAAGPIRSALLRQLLLLDWDYRRRAGDEPHAGDYLPQFPGDRAVVESVGDEMSAAADSTRERVTADARDTPWSGEPAAAGDQPDAGPARYELLGEVGHGGIGVVYRGRDRLLGRDLAVKVLRDTYRDRPDARRRFVAEARVGSQLQHPAIVPVYELGRSADGRPYITMKLVEGHTLAALLCDRPDPAHDLPRFLGVFEQVCQAMAYAHSKGVIHRDLKPSNVMVGAFGEVQVMDWGFAKIAGSGQAAAGSETSPSASLPAARCPLPAHLTHSGALMGTPSYMPPEQARGDAALIDPRADVFALGGILCEILTGLPPYAADSAEEVYRRAAAGDLADAHARLDACAADATLRDLAKRCLAADRAARPADGGEVARAMTAHLASAQERLRRAEVERAAADSRAAAERRARRRTMALAAALLVGAGVASWQAAVAYGAKHDAQTAASAESAAKTTAQAKEAKARAVLAFFRDHVLEAVRPKDEEGGLGKDATIRAAIDKAEPEIAEAFAGQPAAEAYIRHTMGLSYWHLGEFGPALRQTERALALNRQALGPEDSETLGTMNNLGLVQSALGRFEEARKTHDMALQLQRRVLGPEDPVTITSMHNLANALRNLRRTEDARKLAEQTLELRRRVQGPEHRHTLTTMNLLAGVLLDEGKLDESRALYERTLQARRRALGPEHPGTLESMSGLAAVVSSQGRKEEARDLLEKTLELQRRVLGPDHPETLRSLYNLAHLLAQIDRPDEATLLFREALDVQRRVLGPEHYKTARTMSALAHALDAQGRFDEARQLQEEALRLRTRVLKPEHPETLISMHLLARVLSHQGRLEEARTLYEQTLALGRRVLKPGHSITVGTLTALAWLLATADDPKFRDVPRAMELAKEAVQLDPKDAENWGTLGVAHYRAGRWADAVAALEKAEEPDPAKATAANAFFLAMAHWQLGEHETARRWYGTAAERMAKTRWPPPDLPRFRTEAAQLLGIANPEARR